MTDKELENLRELLKSTKVKDPAEQAYAVELIKSIQRKVVTLVGPEFHDLIRIAQKNGSAKNHSAPAAAQFNIAVKFNVKNIDLMKADYTLTFSESFRETDGEMIDLSTEPLPGFEDEEIGTIRANSKRTDRDETPIDPAPKKTVANKRRPKKDKEAE